jgi:formylglycine-generating enzyme required for sulfatase activity
VAADLVCDTLEKAGMSCWIAPRNIPPGADFPSAIVEAIRSARVLVLLVTEHATSSPHVLSEVGHAFNGKKRIIPFRLSTASLPEDLEYFLSLTQWLDAPEGCSEANLNRLRDATRGALAGEITARGPEVVKRRAWWLAAAAVLLILIFSIVAAWRSHRARVDGATAPGLNSTSSAQTSQPLAKQRTWVNPSDGQSYVWIPAGRFTMGCSESDSECSDDEEPTHPVSIEKGFWLGQTEVTLAAYRKYAEQHHATAASGDDDTPATGVSWAEAKKYCATVGGRLPTEAEWEYAARGGNPQAYYDVVPEIAWYAANSGDAPHPVGKKKPNAFGLYDVLGNVREWVLDRYYNKYDLTAAATGDNVEQPLASNATAVARGGFWASEPAAIRVSHRSQLETDTADPTTGWRCASDHR